MAKDVLLKPELYGQGHNYQKKYGFPQNLTDCFAPLDNRPMKMSAEAKGAYKSTAAV